MKLVLDMNLPPRWADELNAVGHEAAHWSLLGPADASDQHIFNHAAAKSAVLLTHDLDFGTILAASGATVPSVVTVRADGLELPLLALVVKALEQFEAELASGALVVINAKHTRARLLPLHPQ